MKKIVLACIATIMLCTTIYEIAITYAKYQSSTNVSIKENIARWNIKLNDYDIKSGFSDEISIENFTLEENDNVKSGRIAPGVVGNFELILDPEGTDVPVRYDISFNEVNLEQIKVISIKQKETGSELIRTSNDTYTGVIPLSEIKNGQTATISIKLEWANNDENNETDTEIGLIQGYYLDFPIKLHVEQYLGEELVQFEG